MTINAVFSWRCKCGARIKVVGETELQNPMAKCAAECPKCSDTQFITASRIVSVCGEEEESKRTF